jgi:hypothetical protein
MATNYFKGKYMQGTFSNGEGPVMGQKTVIESERKGLLTGGEGGGKTLTPNNGPTTITPPTPAGDGLFSLRGANYVGPQNMQPDNKGTVNPFDLDS